jgi:hypothetical protein
MGYPREEREEIIFQVLTVRRKPVLVARISALHKLKEVLSCCLAFHDMGPPERMMMAPLILWNLKRGN